LFILSYIDSYAKRYKMERRALVKIINQANNNGPGIYLRTDDAIACRAGKRSASRLFL
jgi:hypothetical protein